MTAEHILSKLRLAPFDASVHSEAQRASQFPEYAVVPDVVPDGSRNPEWNTATHCVIPTGGGHFTPVEICSL